MVGLHCSLALNPVLAFQKGTFSIKLSFEFTLYVYKQQVGLLHGMQGRAAMKSMMQFPNSAPWLAIIVYTHIAAVMYAELKSTEFV